MNTGEFLFCRVRSHDADASSLVAAATGSIGQAITAGGGSSWGLFEGQFGIASNELLAMAALPAAAAGEVTAAWSAVPGATLVDCLELEATARPRDAAPMARPGLYVFRFFEVDLGNVEEIVRLSREAWLSFEASDAYRAEPMGLFRSASGQPQTRMLLVTWYDGFDSWQTSRQPAPAARENFLKRRRLTRGTIAYATRLVTASTV